MPVHVCSWPSPRASDSRIQGLGPHVASVDTTIGGNVHRRQQRDGRKSLLPLLVPMSCGNDGHLRLGLQGTLSLLWVQWGVVGASLGRH